MTSAMTPLAKVVSTLPRQQVSINKIQIRPEHRPPNAEAINGIVDGFKRTGQLQPILVREIDEDRFRLMAGRQRLEAARALGWDRIDARVIPTCTDKEARMIEISENLHRAELTALERAEQIEEWRRLCNRKANAQVGHSGGKPSRGVSQTARDLGITRQEVERAEKIASITPAAKEAAKEAGIGKNQAKLLEVAAVPAEKQVKAVEVIRERRKRKRKPAKKARPVKPDDDSDAAIEAAIAAGKAEAEKIAIDLVKLNRNLAQRLHAHLGEGMWLKDALARRLHDDDAGGDPEDDIFADAAGSDPEMGEKGVGLEL